MVVIDMKSMPPKAIRREACLWTRGPSWLSKDPRPKRRPNIWKREESKETMDVMKVKNGDVHHDKYNDHYMKQWIKIPKAT